MLNSAGTLLWRAQVRERSYSSLPSVCHHKREEIAIILPSPALWPLLHPYYKRYCLDTILEGRLTIFWSTLHSLIVVYFKLKLTITFLQIHGYSYFLLHNSPILVYGHISSTPSFGCHTLPRREVTSFLDAGKAPLAFSHTSTVNGIQQLCTRMAQSTVFEGFVQHPQSTPVG